MRLGLLMIGLTAATTAAALAIQLGAGMQGAIFAYGGAAVASVLGGALFWASVPRPDRQELVLRSRRPVLRDTRHPPPRSRRLGAMRAQARARDSSAAA